MSSDAALVDDGRAIEVCAGPVLVRFRLWRCERTASGRRGFLSRRSLVRARRESPARVRDTFYPGVVAVICTVITFVIVATSSVERMDNGLVEHPVSAL